jgi:predicted secreted acid phosphatase
MRTAVIFDIDNTIANIDHRLHYIEHKPKNWVAFFQSCSEDKPIESIIGFANQAGEVGHYIIFITGRREEEYTQTTVWLHKYIKQPYALFMRPTKDYTKDYVLKEQILLGILPYFKIILAIDDKKEVAEMYKKHNIPTLHLTWDNTQ